MKKLPPLSQKQSHILALILLFLLAAVSIGSALFSTEKVISSETTDTASQFLFARGFGFGELAKGNLALWNPYNYGGAPFLGDFQSALLYPLNIIFLILPLATAINWSFALHVFLLGAGVYAWAFQRGLRSPAAFVAGAAAMFSGTFYLHIYAGHMTNIAGMPWAPLIFLGIDGWLARRHGGWILLASAAAALQIYAGHPQYVFYTALVAGLYTLTQLPGVRRLPQALLGLIAIYPLAALLAAAQLLPGLAAGAESVRSGGTTYEFASMFSFPPENMLTLLAPWFFGNMQEMPYWGRCYLWEMSFFAGTGMVLLAIHGFFRRSEKKETWRLLIMLALTLVLALGAHTPLHRILYDWLPGFNLFRSPSKFIFFSGLFIALLAGMGFDRLLSGEKPAKTLCILGIAAGAVLLVAGWMLSQNAGVENFKGFGRAVVDSRESYLNPAFFQQNKSLVQMQSAGVSALYIAGAALLVFSLLFLAVRQGWKPAVWVVATAAVLEVFFFARSSVVSFPMKDFTYQPIADFLKKQPGDYRTLNMFNPDAAMLLRSENVWGYDPSVLKRYARLLHLSQGSDPETASQYLQFRQPHPILSMLRCRFAFVPKADGNIEIIPMGEPFPHFYVVSDYEVLEKEKILEAMKKSQFDLRNKVLLEKEPLPTPEKRTGTYEVRVNDFSTDHWDLEIVTESAALLVIPDTYSKDWQATALPDSVQTNYEVLPANYAVRAIPLAGGRHRLRMEYSPAGFSQGIGLSLLSICGLIAFTTVPALRRRLAFSPPDQTV